MYHCVERMIQPKCGEGRCELELYKRPPRIYLQLIEQLEREIASGALKPGSWHVRRFGSWPGRWASAPTRYSAPCMRWERSGLLISRGTEGKTVTEDTVRIEGIRQDLARQTLEAFYREMSRLGFTNEQSLQLAETFSRSAKEAGRREE